MILSSDADSDVLADYVLALLRADSAEGDLRADAIQNLNDFLQDSKFTGPSLHTRMLHLLPPDTDVTPAI